MRRLRQLSLLQMLRGCVPRDEFIHSSVFRPVIDSKSAKQIISLHSGSSWFLCMHSEQRV